LLKKLHAELKDITRIEKANTHTKENKPKQEPKNTKKSRLLYKSDKRVDGYLTANDNERIERANRIHGFLKAENLLKNMTNSTKI